MDFSQTRCMKWRGKRGLKGQGSWVFLKYLFINKIWVASDKNDAIGRRIFLIL